jgi:predicted porin
MKKTLAALAVLGTFAGVSAAANVTLYGLVDEGLVYSHYDQDADGTDSVDNFGLQSGVNAGSRWGIKGEEEIGSVTVGFNLESGFNADDGTSAQGGRLFGRMALLYVRGAYGELAAGRTGALTSNTGRYGLAGATSALGTAYGDYTALASAAFANTLQRVDNMLTYKTPTFAGFTGYAQYSFRMDDKATDGTEGTSAADRYYALGLKYANGPFNAVLIADMNDYAATPDDPKDYDDGYTVTLGGNYDFGPARLYLAGQYFDEARVSTFASNGVMTDAIANEGLTGSKLQGYGLLLSASFPVAGGTLIAGGAYMDAENADSVENDFDYTRLVGTLAYEYHLSKRTMVYAVASYGQDKIDPDGKSSLEPSYAKAGFGLLHRF